MTAPLDLAATFVGTAPQPALRFVVLGEPMPQGSKIAIASRTGGRPMLADDNSKGLRPWRKAIHNAAIEAMRAYPSARRPLFDGPLGVEMVFTFTRPKSVKRTSPSVRPDADKLARACADSLTTSKLWADDGRVVTWTILKVYAGCDPEALPEPGVRVTVWQLTA